MAQRNVAAKLGKPPCYVERNLSILEFIEWTQAIGVSPKAVLGAVKP